MTASCIVLLTFIAWVEEAVVSTAENERPEHVHERRPVDLSMSKKSTSDELERITHGEVSWGTQLLP